MKKIFIISGVIGFFLLSAACWSTIDSYSFQKAASAVQGQVSGLEGHKLNNNDVYYPRICFVTQQHQLIQYRINFVANPAIYAMGQMLDLLYQSANPELVKVKKFSSLWGLPTILGGLGIGFVLISVLGLLDLRLQSKDSTEKKMIPVEVKNIFFEKNIFLKVNGRSPIQLVYQYHNKDNNKVYELRSDNIWFDPQPFIENRKINVFIHNQNNKYALYIEFIA